MTDTPTAKSQPRLATTPKIGSRRKVAFALAAVFLSIAFTFGALLALDVYLHNKFAASAGLNIWGYRGPTLARKEPGEQRVFMLGGSTTLGYGVSWSDAIPAVLERKLNEDPRGSGTVSVVNLGYNNDGAFSFQYTLRDYEYLQSDVAILYIGYNEYVHPYQSGLLNTNAGRHASAVFRITGYLPILPVILTEKAMVLRYGGDLTAAYRQEKTVFKPDLGARTSASALEAAAAIGRSLDRQLGKLTDAPHAVAVAADARDCDAVRRAVEDVLNRGRDVVVVGQPYISDLHVEQQRALEAMLRKRFPTNPALRSVNLGKLVDLKDPTLAFDGIPDRSR